MDGLGGQGGWLQAQVQAGTNCLSSVFIEQSPCAHELVCKGKTGQWWRTQLENKTSWRHQCHIHPHTCNLHTNKGCKLNIPTVPLSHKLGIGRHLPHQPQGHLPPLQQPAMILPLTSSGPGQCIEAKKCPLTRSWSLKEVNSSASQKAFLPPYCAASLCAYTLHDGKPLNKAENWDGDRGQVDGQRDFTEACMTIGHKPCVRGPQALHHTVIAFERSLHRIKLSTHAQTSSCHKSGIKPPVKTIFTSSDHCDVCMHKAQQ